MTLAFHIYSNKRYSVVRDQPVEKLWRKTYKAHTYTYDSGQRIKFFSLCSFFFVEFFSSVYSYISRPLSTT